VRDLYTNGYNKPIHLVETSQKHWLLSIGHGAGDDKPPAPYVCANHGGVTLQGPNLDTLRELRDELILMFEDIDGVPVKELPTDTYAPELQYFVHDVEPGIGQGNIVIAGFLVESEAIGFQYKRASEAFGRQYAISTREELLERIIR
jgi:hypothetical protein